MIFATGWSIRNSPIAAPDLIDRVPISPAVYPKVLAPPPFVHAARRLLRSSLLETIRVPFSVWMVPTGVSWPELGTLSRTRRTRDANRRTGHITLSPVLS
ncbi:hypothetical protein MHU86_13864 [Fragilaria crotonensis]|nr:hypothetical protein MHU86_13864 [Fragilaria crotonensis]